MARRPGKNRATVPVMLAGGGLAPAGRRAYVVNKQETWFGHESRGESEIVVIVPCATNYPDAIPPTRRRTRLRGGQ